MRKKNSSREHKVFKSILPISAHRAAQEFFQSKEDYESVLLGLQGEMVALQQQIYAHPVGRVLIVLEGPDAAGKGGIIKRLTRFLDPRGVSVVPIGPPNELEKNQHYMQRFFARLPERGRITIFDRSWYGRVLIERVEAFCEKAVWSRAYQEINAVESMLIDDGVLVLKYFIDLTYNEQLKRFNERKMSPFKAWKLTKDDVRNRSQWGPYYRAFCQMLSNTSPTKSPWKVLPGDSKWFCRISVLQDMTVRIRKFLDK